MRAIITFLFTFTGWGLAAQNLVPNPGFDNLSGCPFELNQIHLAEPWETASNDTPGLFNSCSTTPFLNVPFAGRRIDSYQLPRSGEGYAGIFVYSNVNFHSNSQYIETPLKEPMQKGKQYYLEFYVAPDLTPTFYHGYTDAVGMALSDTFYYRELGTSEALPLEPVIENRWDLVTDTAGWTRISGCYTAKGGEAFAIIGNFRNTQETLVEFVNPTYPFNNYFFIEDVLVQAFDPLPDTLLLCDGQPEVLNAAFLDAAYRWNTGQADSVILVQSPGLYIVEAVMEKCVLRDTVVVIEAGSFDSGETDTVICLGETLILEAPLPGRYLWPDGSTGRRLEVSAAGAYAVTVTNNCGQYVFATDVVALDCDCRIYVPTAFSPNGDGINDGLDVFVNCGFEHRLLRFAVFDRWGGQVYASGAGGAPAWDGRAKGRPAMPGLYTWFLEYEILRNGQLERHIKKGEVSLLR
jgi:gliding motility-associated-like protein